MNIGHGFTRIKRMVADRMSLGLVLGVVAVVAIGATLPVTELKVFNSAKTASTSITQDGTALAISTGVDVTGASTFDDDVAVDTDTIFVDASTNRVGIGTATPTVALDVDGRVLFQSSTLEDTILTISTGDSGNANDDPALKFALGGSVIWNILTDNSAGDSFIFYNASWSPILTLETTGNVGIGDSTPDAKLDVAGSAIVEDDLAVGGRVTVGELLSLTNITPPGSNPAAGEFYIYMSSNDLYVMDSNGTAIKLADF